MLTGMDHMTALQLLLEALQPAGQPIDYIAFRDCQLEAAALQGCSHLAELAGLSLQLCRSEGGMGDALQALLQQAPHLRKLNLSRCELRDLPAGRYLAGAL